MFDYHCFHPIPREPPIRVAAGDSGSFRAHWPTKSSVRPEVTLAQVRRKRGSLATIRTGAQVDQIDSTGIVASGVHVLSEKGAVVRGRSFVFLNRMYESISRCGSVGYRIPDEASRRADIPRRLSIKRRSIPLTKSREAKKVFSNAPKRFEQLTIWLKNRQVVGVHICMEATGPYWEALAL
jgi:hypothetical protein